MIAHVVLFKPKRGLSTDERAAFVEALERSLTQIPVIKRASVGRRVVLGRDYDRQAGGDYPFLAVLEFATEDDLRRYLDDPAHRSLGEQFYTKAEAALALDFELLERDRLRDLLAPIDDSNPR
jgi:Stress responsive A/B Barrel Domain